MLAELPLELILHVVSFLTREKILKSGSRLPEYISGKPEFVPDLPSINALCRTNTSFYGTLHQILYDRCASVKPLGELALLSAVELELEGAVDKLVAAGISLDSHFYFDRERCSILQIAAGMGLRRMVVKLLGMYGEEMVHTRESDGGMTALDWAAHCGHMDIVKLLAPIPIGATAVIPHPPLVARSDVVLPPVSLRFQTQAQYLAGALLQSVMLGHREISEYLVLEGADVDYLDRRFYSGTVLYHAVESNNLDLVQLLLASGADPNLSIPTAERIPILATPNLDILQALLDGGANINAEDHYSQSVFAFHKDAETLRFFLEYGADPNHTDGFGQTPLHYACSRGVAAAVELLLQFGATTVEKADIQGDTPVDLAMYRSGGFPEVLKILEPRVRDPDLKLRIETWWEEEKKGGEIPGFSYTIPNQESEI
ncbi:ankyrin repeat-containing domain protein [Mycena galopus ATCC 62051]|nr:ankyrin repeat-containing domain protein [Mycena galopus ATCC 62051]